MQSTHQLIDAKELLRLRRKLLAFAVNHPALRIEPESRVGQAIDVHPGATPTMSLIEDTDGDGASVDQTTCSVEVDYLDRELILVLVHFIQKVVASTVNNEENTVSIVVEVTAVVEKITLKARQ